MNSTAAENRASFEERITPWFAPSDRDLIISVYNFSKDGHRPQRRKDGSRYFEHPRHVALLVMDRFGCMQPAVICAALLHDVLEDVDGCSPERLERMFGKEICQIVVRVTKNPKQGYYDRLIRFGEWPELLVKLCDQLHNLHNLGTGTTPEWRRKQCLETRDRYYPVFDRLARITPADYHAEIVRAIEEIKVLVEAGLAQTG